MPCSVVGCALPGIQTTVVGSILQSGNILSWRLVVKPITKAMLSLSLIQVGQLSVTDERCALNMGLSLAWKDVDRLTDRLNIKQHSNETILLLPKCLFLWIIHVMYLFMVLSTWENFTYDWNLILLVCCSFFRKKNKQKWFVVFKKKLSVMRSLVSNAFKLI